MARAIPGYLREYHGRARCRAACAVTHMASASPQSPPDSTTAYLTTYAEAVRSYAHPVILSFGHEMNGHWYPWGYTHTSPTTFVAAWRHIVTLFRQMDVRNVTWLWTVNIMDPLGGIPLADRVVAG